MAYQVLQRGILVTYPKTPYACQTDITTKIIDALELRKNALLESPTGTGKTLALLCSTLAWQKHQNFAQKQFIVRDKLEQEREKNLSPKIFYLTRTHKQIDQIIRELNTTEYKSVKMTVFGGRETMCINNMVRQEDDVHHACIKLLKKSSCSYNNALAPFKQENKPNTDFRDKIQNEMKLLSNNNLAWNAEEIVKICGKLNYCPYYASLKVLYKDADIIFCPYNYILDPIIRRRMKLNLDGNVFLFDEAHNIEDVCRESASFCITEDELTTERNCVVSASKDVTNQTEEIEMYRKIVDLYDRILKLIHSMRSKNEVLELSSKFRNKRSAVNETLRGSKMVEKLKLLGLSDDNNRKLYEEILVQLMLSKSTTDKSPSYGTKSSQKRKPYVVFDCLEKIISFAYHSLKSESCYQNDFRFALTKKKVSNSDPVFALNVWCMNAATVFSDVSRNAASVILTSGTLSPMDTFQSELGTRFDIDNRKETGHILPADRMLVRSIGHGPTGKPLNYSYKNLLNTREQAHNDFCALLLNVCESVPGGILCFVQSYSALDEVKRCIRNSNLWSKLNTVKKVVFEDKDQDKFEVSMKDFFDVVNKPMAHNNFCTGSLFIAVYRGKIAEGIDFADDKARAIVCLGIPYPNISDLGVQLKMDFNTQHYECMQTNNGARKQFFLTGFNWARVQAYRALNQALGRCIRHNKDWGCLILVDDRLSDRAGRENLSMWIRENIDSSKSYGELTQEMQAFSRRMSTEIVQERQTISQLI